MAGRCRKGGSTFFEGAKYTHKVLDQMNKVDDIFHAFPKSVDGFATKFGEISTKIGGDGKAYQLLEMPVAMAVKQVRLNILRMRTD